MHSYLVTRYDVNKDRLQRFVLLLTLQSLEPRNGIDGFQWGPYHTNITNLLGEIIGVAQDTSDAVNYAIGMLALDDNTLGVLRKQWLMQLLFNILFIPLIPPIIPYLTNFTRDRFLPWVEMESAMWLFMPIKNSITNSLAPGTKDASPVPSDSLCYQQKRLLVKSISSTDTIIIVNDPTYMNEIASWEGHAKNLNMIKIGKELIHYLGVSGREPYRLLNVTRGYWGTKPADHQANDTIYKLQVTLNYGYDGLIPNMELQDKIAEYYADVCYINGLGYYDFDGQEFLFNNGHGYYSAKRFFRKMFERAESHGIPPIRFTGATLSEGSWHYQSIWNVGGGKNLYDVETREWGSSTSQGKDLRDVTYSNFFPVGMGGNFPINAHSTVEQYEHIQAISVGVGSTYSLYLNQKDVESCPEKETIFKVIRTWENARAANTFSRNIKKQLANPAYNWQLEQLDNDHWQLYRMFNGERGPGIKLSGDIQVGSPLDR